jgi:hypothetical protein
MVSIPPPGRLIADVDGARVQCHLCGRFYPKLGMHVRKGHGMDPDEYREQFGLNRGTALASPALSQKLSMILSEDLISLQPTVNPVTAATAEQRAQWRRKPGTRLQARQAIGEGQRRHQEVHPQPRKERPPLLPKSVAHQPGLQRIAELRQDPEWRAAWRAKQAEGFRKRARDKAQLEARHQ